MILNKRISEKYEINSLTDKGIYFTVYQFGEKWAYLFAKKDSEDYNYFIPFVSVRIRNNNYPVKTLVDNYSLEVASAVKEYINDQNCWPDIWASDLGFNEVKTASFIYHSLTHPKYVYNPFK